MKHRGTHGEDDHETMEAETGVMHLQIKECPGWSVTSRNQVRTTGVHVTALSLKIKKKKKLTTILQKSSH